MYLIRVPVEGSEPVLVEAADVADGIVRVARPGEVIAAAGESLQAALERLRPMAEAFVTQLSGLAHAPDEITVDFGVKVDAEAGVVIARTAAAANFSVTVKWNRAA